MPSEAGQLQILFVCLGNICRSPLAEGLLRHCLQQQGLSGHIHVDSAATHAYQVGNPPDRGARRVALLRGVDIGEHRARLLVAEDFERFDLVLVMDEYNRQHAARLRPRDWSGVLALIGEFAESGGVGDIPDPYGEEQGMFEHTARLLEQCLPGLLGEIKRRLEHTAN